MGFDAYIHAIPPGEDIHVYWEPNRKDRPYPDNEVWFGEGELHNHFVRKFDRLAPKTYQALGIEDTYTLVDDRDIIKLWRELGIRKTIHLLRLYWQGYTLLYRGT